MLNLAASKPGPIVERNIATGATIAAEGIPLINAIESGSEVVTPSTGAASEIFVGFSWAHNLVPSVLTRVETHTIPAAGLTQTVTLDKTGLVATQVSVMYGATQFTEHATTPAADTYTCNDTTGVLTFDPAESDAGLEIVVTYKYTPTTAEVARDYPSADVNINPAFTILGSLGVVLSGEIYTDQIDASVDWSTVGNAIYLGAGILTDSGNVTIGGHVTHVPSADNPFLGVQFSNH